MADYKLIAFDMDGTLLTTKKTVSPGTLEAVQKAGSAGKIIIFNTGRCPDELTDFINLMPEVGYLNCISGALVYDVREQKAISSSEINPDLVKRLFEIFAEEDVMYQLLNSHNYMNRSQLKNLAHYHMEQYKESYDRVVTSCNNVMEEYHSSPYPVSKFNAYHASEEGRERSYKRLLEADLPIQIAFAEETSLEISPLGVHKGLGLLELCSYLGIRPEQTIVVGDADNDLKALEVAGLAVAMGNANDNVRKISHVLVSDNDHDGCAEAIYQYLL